MGRGGSGRRCGGGAGGWESITRAGRRSVEGRGEECLEVPRDESGEVRGSDGGRVEAFECVRMLREGVDPFGAGGGGGGGGGEGGVVTRETPWSFRYRKETFFLKLLVRPSPAPPGLPERSGCVRLRASAGMGAWMWQWWQEAASGRDITIPAPRLSTPPPPPPPRGCPYHAPLPYSWVVVEPLGGRHAALGSLRSHETQGDVTLSSPRA